MGGVTLAIQAYSINVGWHWQTTVFTTLASSSFGHGDGRHTRSRRSVEARLLRQAGPGARGSGVRAIVVAAVVGQGSQMVSPTCGAMSVKSRSVESMTRSWRTHS